LFKILSVLNEKLRVEYISILWELASESDVNWRFRLLLAQQLDDILYLYDNETCRESISSQLIPLIFQLCQDRMAEVRHAAVYPIADAINILHGNGNANDNDNDNDSNKLECITQKIESIHKGRTYSKRLLYIRIADACFDRIDGKLFDAIFLNDLLNYSNDQIFNVRFSLSRFIRNHLQNEKRYEENKDVTKAIEILKNDEEDVEIKRCFMSVEEIEDWLHLKKEQRQKNDLLLVNCNEEKDGQQQHASAKAKESDSDSTDSSLYSDSNSDSTNDDDDDDDDDQLKSVSQQLNSINDDLQNNKLNEEEEEHPMSQGLVHQDTPYKLNFSKDLVAANEAEKQSQQELNVGDYGMEHSKQTDDDVASVEID